uniref:MATH domain-containing protein n=1 Tax=Kalanchoe fedtschenkoi TaxID=63787 RepID=A0A7N0URU6_KALFE
MAGTLGHGGSTEGNSSMQRCESGEALTEWRSSEQLENGTPSTSPPYWDSDDEDDSGLKPSDLYGKYTWKIDKFPQINKRELRSDAFEVGGYKWYILIYPQGCDVCNHLSLFLCVANHDKLLPGWSHFAQFTISVVNKDPKKSKYSDTLHRFWKKEHDWGWKKFMELSKVSDGFLDDDTLIIKAQVQVIREKVNRPFRCLDCQYRRELVRVYLTNVEQICRRFVEERRNKLVKLIEDETRWTSFCSFWQQIEESTKQWMSREKTDIILKIVVKHFFIEKEVTSTLVMDSLYSGLKALEGQTNCKKGLGKALQLDKTTAPIIRVEKDMFVLVDDVLPLLERAAMEPLPPKDEKGPQNRTKDGGSGDDSSKDTIERDERRLTELGRRTVEIFVLAHIFSNKIEVAYQEAVALRRQEDLIREEAESEKKTKHRLSEKDKKSKKKLAKQKRSNRRAKDKVRDENPGRGSDQPENLSSEMKDFVTDVVLPTDEKPDVFEEKSDISDSIDFVGGEAQQSDSEDRDSTPINWDTDTSENHPPAEACRGFSLPNGITERKSSPRMDDSSSTCSTDSISSVVVNSSSKGNSFPQIKDTSLGRKNSQQQKVILEAPSRVNGLNSKPSGPVIDTGRLINDSGSCKVATSADLAFFSYQDLKNATIKKDAVSPPNKPSIKEKSVVTPSFPVSPPKSSVASPPIKLVAQNNILLDSNAGRKKSIQNANPNGQSIPSVSALPSKATSRPDPHPISASKPAEKSVVHQVPLLSRPSSAPIVPGPRPAAPAISMHKATPQLGRSVSVAGRLGPDTLSSSAHSFIPQSYRNAMMGNTEGASSSSFTNDLSPTVSSSAAYVYPSTSASSSTFVTSSLNSVDLSSMSSGFSFGATTPGVFNNGTQWMDSSLTDNVNRNAYMEPSSLASDMQNLNLQNFLRSGSLEYIPTEFLARSTGRQVQVPPADEFPHIDIINDLLDDEFGIRNTASSSGSFSSYTSGSGNSSFGQLLNRQLSFPGEMSLSGDLASSASSLRLGRTQSYHDDGLHRSYNSYGSINSAYGPTRDLMPHGSIASDFQTDHYRPSHWQLPSSHLHSPLQMQCTEGDCYSYGLPEFSNPTGGVNSYGSFRPSNGL